MMLEIAGATIVVPASTAGAATSTATPHFQCACNPYLILESEILGLPLVGNVSPTLGTVFALVNAAVADIP